MGSGPRGLLFTGRPLFRPRRRGSGNRVPAGEHNGLDLQLRRTDRLGVPAGGHRGAYAQRGSAQEQRGQVVVHDLRAGSRIRIRHGEWGHPYLPVLGHEPGEQRPPPAVADRLVEGGRHLSVVERALGIGDGVGIGRAWAFDSRARRGGVIVVRGRCTWERAALSGRVSVFLVIPGFSCSSQGEMVCSHVHRPPACTWERVNHS